MSSCPGRSSPFPRWCKKPPSCPRSTSPLQLPPRSWARTSACLQNGFVLGTAGLLDGLAERFQAELGPDIRFYATGNLPRTIREACRTPIEYREYLITDGLYRIWQKNRKG